MRMEAGLSVVHLFAKPTPSLDRDAVIAAIRAAEADECQVITAALLGHKADVAFMTLAPDWRTQRTLQTALARAGLEIVDSYVSITEVSEYAKGMPEDMLRARMYPQLPPEGLNAFCFYPMSKKREGHANWFATPYDERNEMMMEHGKSGRTFAGRVTQLVTGSTGLDDHEWGVTLFAASPDVIKDVVYTMRFDKGSALYGEFGTFYVGYLDFVENVI
jgi:chlorite dismutase